MDALASLADGFAVALTFQNLFLALVGCFLGTIIGALPGLGPSNGVAILIPLAFSLGLAPTPALILLTSVYYGAMYGGRISSILLNIPGDEPALMTTLDGYPMAQQGRAGEARVLDHIEDPVVDGHKTHIFDQNAFGLAVERVALLFIPNHRVGLAEESVVLGVVPGVATGHILRAGPFRLTATPDAEQVAAVDKVIFVGDQGKVHLAPLIALLAVELIHVDAIFQVLDLHIDPQGSKVLNSCQQVCGAGAVTERHVLGPRLGRAIGILPLP